MNNFNLKNFLVENKLTKNSKAIEETVEEVIEEVTEETAIEEVEIPLEEEETVEGTHEKTEELKEEEASWERVNNDEEAVAHLNAIIAKHGLEAVQQWCQYA